MIVLRSRLQGLSLWARMDGPLPVAWCATWDQSFAGREYSVVPSDGCLWWKRAIVAVNVARNIPGYGFYRERVLGGAA